MAKGYADGKLFITSKSISKIKYALQKEQKDNGAKDLAIFYNNNLHQL